MSTSARESAPSPAPSGRPSGQIDATAWRDDELTDPHGHAEKATKVRSMFEAIAPSYDLNNRIHSLWIDQRWRAAAVRAAGVTPTDRVLDVACGTGDLTLAFAKAGAASVIGADFTRGMLDVAVQKTLGRPEHPRITYVEADAMRLPIADASVDIVSIAFGIRNVAVPADALGEFARVLTPGGRLIVLEFDQPRNPLVRFVNSVYCAGVMPRTATIVSNDRSGAYKYLPKSVGKFMTRDEMSRAITDAGFDDVSARPLTFGLCALYRGVRR